MCIMQLLYFDLENREIKGQESLNQRSLGGLLELQQCPKIRTKGLKVGLETAEEEVVNLTWGGQGNPPKETIFEPGVERRGQMRIRSQPSIVPSKSNTHILHHS